MERVATRRNPSPSCLISTIETFLAGQDLPAVDAIHLSLENEIAAAGPAAVSRLLDRLSDGDSAWTYYPPDPLARRMHQVLAAKLLHPDCTLSGTAKLQAVRGEPVVLFSNHLSYADANLVEILVKRSPASELAGRLTAIAGPKVYTNRRRHFSSLCFGTIRTPQSHVLSTGAATMNARDVARAARQSIAAAHERLAQGDALLVFGEGTRSRQATLQRMLAASARYLEAGDAWVLPVGITGTEELFPIGEPGLHPVRAAVTIGRPLRGSDLLQASQGNRQLLMDVVGVAVSELLPESYRGVYGSNGPDLSEARRLLGNCGHGS